MSASWGEQRDEHAHGHAHGHGNSAEHEQELADALDRLIALDEDARRAHLDEIGAKDAARAKELAELLAMLPDPERPANPSSDERAAVSGDGGGGPSDDDDRHAGEPAVGETLGGCVLESVLGRGGIGTVYAARQIEPSRAVAVKVLRLARARERDFGRFRTEANALARLEHPAIARIYASGVEPRAELPLPYIVMERIVDASSIIDWARAPGRTHREVALAFAEVCDGMQHGHNRGVIHRDLKPSNILVDAAGHPRVIDFGIARLVSPDDTQAQETAAGALLGTPAYMAPEQFDLPGAELDARIDIHAVGLMLYEAVLGRRAYAIDRERAFDARRIIRETDPPVPHRADSAVSPDLSAVTMKAMAKDRGRRYQSMGALAADLRAYADGLAVSARAETRGERFVRLVRRNPVLSAAVALAFISLATAYVLSTSALGEARRRSAAAEMVIAMSAAGDANVRETTAALGRIAAPVDPVLRGMVERLLDDSTLEPTVPFGGHLVGGAISPDGSRWAVGSDGGKIAVFDAHGRELGRASIGDSSMWGLGFSRNASRLYAGSWVGAVYEIDLAPIANDGAAQPVELGARQIASIPGLVRSIVASRDDTRLLVLSSPLVLSTIDLATGRVEASSASSGPGMARSLAWLGEGRAYAVGTQSPVAAFDVPEKGPPVAVDLPWLTRLSSRNASIGLSRDGSMLAIGDMLGRVRIFDTRTGEPRASFACGHDVWSLDFSPDGTRVAVAERGGRVHEISSKDGSTIVRHGTLSAEPAWAAAYTPDGSLHANIGTSYTRFEAGTGWATRPDPLPRGFPRALAVLGRNTEAPVLRAAATDGTVWDLDIASGVWKQVPLAQPVAPGAAAFDPSGTRLAAWSDSGVEIVSLDDGTRVRTPIAPRGNRAVAWDPAGDELTLVSSGDVIIIRDDGTQVARATVEVTSGGLDIVYEAPRKPVVFICFGHGAGLVRDGKGGLTYRKAAIPSSTRIIRDDSRWILPCFDGTIFVSQKGGLQGLAPSPADYEFGFVGHTDVSYAAAIVPDGHMLATGGADTRIRFWDLLRGELLTTSTVCREPIRALEWIDKGRALIAIDGSGNIALLDSVPRRTRFAQRAARESPVVQPSTR